MNSRLVPALYSCLRQGYSKHTFMQDLMAGLTVGIVALPLAIAFAIASGVKPEQGLFTAIIAGGIISLLGGSRVQIGGPTGAFIVVVFAIVQEHGTGGLALATLMAGALLLIMGLSGMGAVIKFIPYPMTVGFTGGIALIIAATQVKDLLGLSIPDPRADFPGRIADLFRHASSLSGASLLVGGLSLATLIFLPKVTRRVPASIAAILLGTLLVHLLDLPVDTIGSRFGSVPSMLPSPSLPEFEWSMIPQLISPALTIALLGAIESLLSAVVADGMTGQRHRSNMELVAQGVANLASPLFGGIPATGAIARTATNVKSGARTPVAGIVHALCLLAILLFFGPLATLIPLASLAAVLLVVAFHMSEWRHFVKLLKAPPTDILVLATTFGLTVFVDLTVAIETGIVLSALLFMKRMADITEVRQITKELYEERDPRDELASGYLDVPEGVEVFEVYGPFFFGAASQFKDTLSLLGKPPKVLILRMRHILSIDATALHALEEVLDRTRHEGTTLLLSGVQPSLRRSLERSGLADRIGAAWIHDHIFKALACARDLMREREAEAA